MAAALLKSKQPHLHIKSAGIFANENSAPNRHAVRALHEYDIQLIHEATEVTEKLLDWANIILTMTTNHVQSLVLQYPQFEEKYFTLKEYALGADNKVRKKLQASYADFERKQSEIIQENQLKLDPLELEKVVLAACEEEIANIRKLEVQMIDYNISDPFGRSFEVYAQTLDELNDYIDLIIEKIKRN